MLAELVLQHVEAWRGLGNLETRLLGKRLQAVPIERPVFITGLARAGTTILLRKLCELPGFVSHRYADFPFLFTPYAWSRICPARNETPRERMHKDRITITPESPEAMEEVLWMAFFPHLHDPSQSNVLGADTDRPEFERFFADHIRKLLLARSGRRYVSKNNYDVTRLSYLARLFPDARFIIPVREPHAHVASLMKQQALFTREAATAAARRHLTLVGHFEFGLDRRPINPGDGVQAVEALWDAGEEARGWARYWALIYRHVLDRLEADPELARRSVILHYEELCRAPQLTMGWLGAHVGVPCAEMAGLATGLSEPDYYQPNFTSAERAAIDAETDAVRARLTDRARSPGPPPAGASSSSLPGS